MKGKIFVITGTSGSGKTTLANAIIKHSELNLSRVVSYTSRSPRGGEKNGVHYNFISREQFEKFIEQGEFFEHAEVYGNYYGSLKNDVNCLLDSGKNVLFVIDVQGAETIKRREEEIVTIFVRTSSINELRKRIEKRGEDSPEKINQRLETAKFEEEKASLFDHVLVNDVLSKSINELCELIKKKIL